MVRKASDAKERATDDDAGVKTPRRSVRDNIDAHILRGILAHPGLSCPLWDMSVHVEVTTDWKDRN